MLDLVSEMYYTLEDVTLNKLVQEAFPRQDDFGAVQYWEWHNDSYYVAKTSSELDANDKEDLQEFADRAKDAWTVSLQQMLTYLATKGQLPFGNYIVTVCW